MKYEGQSSDSQHDHHRYSADINNPQPSDSEGTTDPETRNGPGQYNSRSGSGSIPTDGSLERRDATSAQVRQTLTRQLQYTHHSSSSSSSSSSRFTNSQPAEQNSSTRPTSAGSQVTDDTALESLPVIPRGSRVQILDTKPIANYRTANNREKEQLPNILNTVPKVIKKLNELRRNSNRVEEIDTAIMSSEGEEHPLANLEESPISFSLENYPLLLNITRPRHYLPKRPILVNDISQPFSQKEEELFLVDCSDELLEKINKTSSQKCSSGLNADILPWPKIPANVLPRPNVYNPSNRYQVMFNSWEFKFNEKGSDGDQAELSLSPTNTSMLLTGPIEEAAVDLNDHRSSGDDRHLFHPQDTTPEVNSTTEDLPRTLHQPEEVKSSKTQGMNTSLVNLAQHAIHACENTKSSKSNGDPDDLCIVKFHTPGFSLTSLNVLDMIKICYPETASQEKPAVIRQQCNDTIHILWEYKVPIDRLITKFHSLWVYYKFTDLSDFLQWEQGVACSRQFSVEL
ncbi:hypothetical protein SBOR_5262 [Sclerotinia borealis F-4128]|uniref:Uncharacterized protein n=1 Tax=Sclerotinia borealis (strain F-4128) TaxID=1432307 RepID=W9CEQ8_SCLBF|nr:hypothetical protein SBOR_5262 [Sclerotinia borealis F-4128]